MKETFKTVNSILLLIIALFSQQVIAQNTADSIDTFIKEKMTQLKIPGLQLAIIKNGKLDKLQNYGFSSIEHQVPTNSRTTFSINSITKAFVGIAIMQLQEQGKLNINNPISSHISDISENWKSITIKQLLSNVSGLPNNIDGKEQLLGDGLESKNWEMVKKLPMEFKPGEKFSYNQTGYYILGRIINSLSGQHFTQFIEENQFKPCQMTSTRFGDSDDIIPNNSNSYSTIFNDGGKWINDGKLHNSYISFPLFFRTATGIISTSEDLSKWLIALQNGELLKNKESISQMFTTTKLNNGEIGGFNKLTNGYALGWPTVERDEHRAVAPVGGMRSTLFVYPKDNLSIVVLTNLQGSNPEWFVDEIAGYYFPDMKIKNGFGLSKNLKLLRQNLIKNNYQNPYNNYQKLRQTNQNYTLTEEEVNTWGYQLLEQDKKNEALQIFKLNTLLFPKSWNVYDSYGETLETLENRKEAVINYRKSLELNPDNTNARKYLDDKK
ncbi:serine hydrolase domain-containing protein [Chryseobacterium sp. 3008163]|uniref:serine hydrolase domain-containing protein n=1 Tax=Chryseobacterium sp. 3008163 TaxID=2478663 RepID=UPI000F0D029B|nr:serine hydrolase domain-containing protein [Chryseobacterium sp. 3008163]AYM99648.1 class A beta-lactamase-related serine hydrolase [Chryseobacterium sp. 3008163]